MIARRAVAVPPGWLPDWRDPSAYRFERLDRPGFAWEWLRRDPGYRDVASCAATKGALGERVETSAAHWGLVRFEPPELAAPEARPFWRAEVDSAVLAADVSACGTHDTHAMRLGQFGNLLTLVGGGDASHLLLTDGWRHLRIDLHGPFDPAVPLLPRWRLLGLTPQPQLLALRRLMSVVRSGEFASRLWPPEPRARRWILALRAHDALAAGMGHRVLAELLGAETEGERWRIREPSIRLQAQRLAALARSLQGKGFAKRYLGRVL